MTQPMKIKLSDIEKLSKEEMLAFTKRVQKLQKDQSTNKIEEYFENAHEGQVAFHKCKKRVRYVFAGNRGGKTTAGFNELKMWCQGTHPFQKTKVPLKSAVIIPDYTNHGKKVFEPKLKEWTADKDFKKKPDRNQAGAITTIYWSSGSTTDVYSHDQDPVVFEGSDYDVVWFDEPPPRKIYTAMWRSLTDRGGRMYLTGTPLNCDWLFSEFQKIRDKKDHPLMWYTVFDRYANAKNLGEGDADLGKQRLEELASLYDEEERAARVDGQFVQMTGMIFKAWSQAEHVIDQFPIPYKWEIIESIDPHPQKPWAVVWVAIAPNGAKILLQSLYLGESIDEVADGILMGRANIEIQEGLQPRIVRTLIDNSSSVPMYQKSHRDPTARRISVREELELMIGPRGGGGPRIEVAPKNVQGKIDLFKRWLRVADYNGKKRPDFYVFQNEDNLNFIKEIEHYRWAQYKGGRQAEATGRPVKKNDDIIDAVLQVVLTLGKETSLNDYGQPLNLTGEFRGYGTRKTLKERSNIISRFSR